MIDYKIEVEKLIRLCLSANDVYIYGAGEYAKYIYYLLIDNHVQVSGFITTSEEGNKYLGKTLMPVKEYKKRVKEEDLIIPGFKGCSAETIKQQFCSISVLPHIAEIDPYRIKSYFLYNNIKDLYNFVKMRYPVRVKNEEIGNNVLIIRIDAIGDLVCTTSLIREIRLNKPSAKITIAVNSKNMAIVEECPYIDRIIQCPPNQYGENILDDIRNYKNILSLVEENLKNNGCSDDYDTAILSAPVLEGRRAVESFLYMVKSGARKRIGYCYGADKNNHEIFDTFKDVFSDLQFISTPLHETEFQLEMLRKIGMTIKNHRNELWIDSKDRNNVQCIFNEKGIRSHDIIVAIGIVGSMERRNWSRENYRTLISLVSSKITNLKWVIFGGNDAKKAAAELNDLANVIDLTGSLTLKESIACIEKCHIYLGANTGLMHIAATLNKPCLTIYSVLSDVSPWDGNGPVRFGAKDTIHIDMIPKAGLDGCQGSCKANKPHCINQIKPLEVEEKLMELVKIVYGCRR